MKNLNAVKETIEALNGVYAQVSGETILVSSEKYPSAIVKYAAKKGFELQIVSENEVAPTDSDEFPTYQAVLVLK